MGRSLALALFDVPDLARHFSNTVLDVLEGILQDLHLLEQNLHLGF